MEMAAVWRAFADAAGPVAVAALWQGAALAAGLALCLRLTPRIAAADRFRAWAAGFAALVALPFLPALFSLARPFLGTVATGPAASLPVSAAPHAWLNLDPRWSLAVASVWIAASLARAIDLGLHTVRLRRIWKRATPIALSGEEGAAGAKALRSFAGVFGTTEVVPCYTAVSKADIKAAARVEICTTRDLDRPSVIGFFAPRILIPEWLLGKLTDAELQQVVLHEAEHLRRRDDWMNLLQKVCLAVFPLNPALAWMEGRLCREREMACDEGVVRRTQAPRAYAACLASLAERRLKRRPEALSLGAWQRRPELVDRVHRILRRGPALHPAVARALLGVVGCGLVLGSVELAQCPQVVEFAAPPTALVSNVDATVDGRPMRGYRAIDAVAHVPTRAELAAAQQAQRRSLAAARRAKSSPAPAQGHPRANFVRWGGDEAREVGARSESAKSNVARQPAAETALAYVQGPQQWIVYTEWEQVSSTAPAENPNADRSAPAPQALRQFTVTQLILRVVPANALRNAPVSDGPATAATGATTVPALHSGAAQRKVPIASLPAIPVRDGWLVIQL